MNKPVLEILFATRPEGPGYVLEVSAWRPDFTHPQWCLAGHYTINFAIFELIDECAHAELCEAANRVMRNYFDKNYPDSTAPFQTYFRDFPIDDFEGDYAPCRGGELELCCITQHLAEPEVVKFAEELHSTVEPYVSLRSDGYTLVTGDVKELFKRVLAIFVRLRDLTEERKRSGLLISPPMLPFALKVSDFLIHVSLVKLYHKKTPYNVTFFLKMRGCDSAWTAQIESRLSALGCAWIPPDDDTYCNVPYFGQPSDELHINLAGITLEEFSLFANCVAAEANSIKRMGALVEILLLARKRVGVWNRNFFPQSL